MRWASEYFSGRPLLDDTAEIHHENAVRDLPDEREIVSDEQIRDISLLLDTPKELEHLTAYGDVEGRRGLIEKHDSWVDGERTRDAHPLALPPTELSGVAIQQLGAEIDRLEELEQPARALLSAEMQLSSAG
jgi:hypothetical protein